MYKKILLPTDGSAYANKAAEHAIWIAHASGAEIIALNVIETSSLVGLPAEDLIVRIKEMLKEEGRVALDHIFEMAAKENVRRWRFESNPKNRGRFPCRCNT